MKTFKQGMSQVAEGLQVGPVSVDDATCPLSLNGETIELTSSQRRHLAAYLIAGLPWNERRGSLASQILDLQHAPPDGFCLGAMVTPVRDPEAAQW